MASWKKAVNTRLSRLTGYHTLFVPAHGKLSLAQSTDYERLQTVSRPSPSV